MRAMLLLSPLVLVLGLIGCPGITGQVVLDELPCEDRVVEEALDAMPESEWPEGLADSLAVWEALDGSWTMQVACPTDFAVNPDGSWVNAVEAEVDIDVGVDRALIVRRMGLEGDVVPDCGLARAPTDIWIEPVDVDEDIVGFDRTADALLRRGDAIFEVQQQWNDGTYFDWQDGPGDHSHFRYGIAWEVEDEDGVGLFDVFCEAVGPLELREQP